MKFHYYIVQVEYASSWNNSLDSQCVQRRERLAIGLAQIKDSNYVEPRQLPLCVFYDRHTYAVLL